MISDADGLALWREASEHPVGICVGTDNRNNLMQRLYQIRARNKDEDFTGMMLVHGKELNEVWIMHRPTASQIKPMKEEDLDGI